MDPDQVAAAEVQHDDLGDTATSADAGGDSGGSGDSWGRALLRRGWDLSRKAAIAGVAATAAPVVAPPLLVLSVAGLALSFPFAAYLASVFATERLMGALLPPPRTQPYHTWDLEDDEFLDAPEGPGCEDPVFNYWSEAEDGAIMEEDESYASLPLSQECRLFEEPVPASSDNENPMSEGEFRLQESGYESFVFDNTAQSAQKEEDNEYITMEAPPPRAFDDSSSRSAAPELCEEDDMVPRIKEAPVAAEEPVQELSVSDNGDKTEDLKLKATEEMEASKEMVSLDIGIDTTGVSDFPVPDDSTLQSMIEDDVAVEMVLEEVTIDTNPVTEEVVGVQMEAIATELPESESLYLSDPVAQESQMIAVTAYVDDVLESTVTEDIVLDIGDTNTEAVEHIGVGDVSSVVSVATVDDVADLACSTSTLNVLAISDDKMIVDSRPDVDPSTQTTGVDYTRADKSAKTEERKSMDSEVSTRSMTPQEIDVSESPGPDDQSKKEDEVTVETVLEEVTSTTDLVTGEVVGVQVDIVASGSESLPALPLSDLVAQELQPVTGSATAESIQGSTVRGDIVMGTDDTSTGGVEQHSEGGASSFISGASALTMDDDENVVSSRKPFVSAIGEDIKSVEGEPDVEHPHETTVFGNKLTDEGLKRKGAAEDKSAKTKERKSMDNEVYTSSMTPQEIGVSKSPGPDDQSKKEDEVTVETVLKEVTSTTDLVTGEVVGVQVHIVASESESLPLSDLVAQELQPVAEATSVESIKGSTARGNIVMDTDDTSTEGVEQHSEGGASSFISGASAVTMDDDEDIMSSRRKLYVSAIIEDIKSVEGKPVVEHPHVKTGSEYKLTNEGLESKFVAADKDDYTEEQLREQVDTLRTITGYHPTTALTLEADLAGLYMFVGVEPPVSSRDASDLTEINVKLRFLKSIIGVE